MMKRRNSRRNSKRNPSNSSSRQINSIVDLVDRISALPDSILSRILSHLPTRNAVATTILSKRWKFMWMTVHNLDFSYMDFMADEEFKYEENEEDSKFARFVNHVLLLHDGGSLNKFRLEWKLWFIPSQVIPWINTAITRNVHELVLSVNGLCEEFIKPLEMPVSVFNCVSLQYLELNGTINVSSAIVVCLPRLESLKLVSVYFHSEEAFEKLICGCPVLNYLHIDMENLDLDWITIPPEKDNFKYIISSTSLRRLVVDVGYPEDVDCICRLQLEASSLEYLEVDGPIPQVSVQGSLSSLVEVDFRIQLCYGDNYDLFIEAVRAFDCAKTLTLSGDAMWALSNATISLPTEFSRLTKLEAGTVCCYCSSLLDIIQCSDSLEDLTIYRDSTDVEEYDIDHEHDQSNWTAPIEVPRCLSNSLKKISLKGFGGFDNEREMIGYMLRHGSVLEVMQMMKYDMNSGLIEEISRFPRKSPTCKVEFISR